VPGRDYQQGIHGRPLGEAVVGQDHEAGLRLDRPQRISDQERIDLRVVATGDRKTP
jgi:hypothetical protein